MEEVIALIKSVGFPTRATDPTQIAAKLALAAEYRLPKFYLELLLPGDDVLQWDVILAHAKRNNLPYNVVHGPFTRYADIHSGDWGLTGTVGFEHLKLAAELANKLGAKRFVVHDDTYAKNTQPPEELAEMRQRLWPIAVDNLKALKAICPGTTVENLTLFPWADTGDFETVNLFSVEGPTVTELARQARLEGITYDVSHGFSHGGVLASPLAVSQQIGVGWIRHLHLASYAYPYYEGLPLGTGLLTPQMLSDLLGVLDGGISVTIEVNEPDVPLRFVDLPNLRRSLDWLREFEFLAAA